MSGAAIALHHPIATELLRNIAREAEILETDLAWDEQNRWLPVRLSP